MSRSYKKFPLFRDTLWGRSMKEGKQYANRKIRRKLKNLDISIPKGSCYKRLGIDSWDLYEYKSYQTKQDTIDEWERECKEIENGVNSWKSRYHQTLEQDISDWYRSYKRK